MAIIRVDEFDRKTEAEVVEFSLDGVDYEIDLSKESKKQLQDDLKRYIDVARRKQSPAKRTARKTSSAHRPPAAETTINNDAIRDWARKDGRFGKVSDRGRVPREIMDAFNEEHDPQSAAKLFSSASA